MARFVDAFFGRFEALTRSPRHPKWREVNLAALVPGWSRFPEAQAWLARQAVAAGTPPQDFGDFLTRTGGAAANLSGAQKDALFREFLNWQSDRGRSR